MADQDRAGAAEDGDQPQAPPQQQMQRVEVTDKHAISLYANFCRVTGTPEELILDFGLNAQPFGVPTEPVDVKQRIVVNYFTAKRMLQACTCRFSATNRRSVYSRPMCRSALSLAEAADLRPVSKTRPI